MTATIHKYFQYFSENGEHKNAQKLFLSDFKNIFSIYCKIKSNFNEKGCHPYNIPIIFRDY